MAASDARKLRPAGEGEKVYTWMVSLSVNVLHLVIANVLMINPDMHIVHCKPRPLLFYSYLSY